MRMLFGTTVIFSRSMCFIDVYAVTNGFVELVTRIIWTLVSEILTYEVQGCSKGQSINKQAKA